MTCLDGSAKYVDEAGVEVSQLVPETSLVMLIPMRELHITCDRYTKANMPDVKKYIGKVNSDGFFLGCAPDTLLCEAADVDQSFAPDMSQPDGPHRFRITALFKERRVPKAGSSNAIGGWNYEYVAPTKPNPAGFYKVILPGTKTLRYDQMSFANFFTG